MNEAIAFKKTVKSCKATELGNVRAFLYTVRCQWEHPIRQSGGEEEVL
jgi:hypothetical protein